MEVGVDHPWHQRCAGKVEHRLTVSGGIILPPPEHLLDALAIHDHGAVGLGRMLAIDQVHLPEYRASPLFDSFA